jgi:hypothetical protein
LRPGERHTRYAMLVKVSRKDTETVINVDQKLRASCEESTSR